MIDDTHQGRTEPLGHGKPPSTGRLPAVLATAGAALGLLGIFLGRGLEQGMGLIIARLFMLVLGLSVLIAGLVGLAARAIRGKQRGTGSGAS